VPAPIPTADAETVRRSAAAVLAGAGVDVATSKVVVRDGTLTADPVVDGRRTVGWQTSVTVGHDGSIEWANGWLGRSSGGVDYPMITAKQAYEQLQSQPLIRAMGCLQPLAPTRAATATPDSSGVGPAVEVFPCGGPSPEPTPVTAVEFGWTVLWLDGDAVDLAPAWLFTTGDANWPQPVTAIEPAYLPQPVSASPEDATGATDSGSGTDAGGGTGAGGGPVELATTGSVPPGKPTAGTPVAPSPNCAPTPSGSGTMVAACP
jgi:hypothetical protein